MPVAGALVVLNGVLLVVVALEADAVVYCITLLGVDSIGVVFVSCVFSCFLSDLEW